MSKKQAPAVANLLSSAADHAREKTNTVRVLCALLAEHMQGMHGGDWWVQIDHETGFVVVRRRQP